MMMMHAQATPELAIVRELRLLLPQPGEDPPDPASSSFSRIIDGLNVELEREINPHVDKIVEPLGAWAHRHGLAGEVEIARRLEQVCFNRLVAQTYPKAPYEEFLLSAKWCTWLFFHDDWLCDRHESSEQGVINPEVLAAAHRSLLEVLDGRAPNPDDPLELSLHEFGHEAREWGNKEWMERFRDNVYRHFQANEWEARNRQRRIIPSVSEYIKMRPFAGAVYTAFDFIDLVEDLELSPEVRNHGVFRELTLLANNCICWVNDLFSLAKEIFEGNPNNIVLALREEQSLSLGEAMIAAVELHNDEYRKFELLARELASLDLLADRDLRSYLSGMRSWMLGNAAWSRQTLRYQELLNMIL